LDRLEPGDPFVVDLRLDQEDELRAGVQRIAAILAVGFASSSHG
jgi:hypothetical protein